MIDSDIFPLLITLCETAPATVRKEAVWALANATSGSNLEQIQFLFKLGIVKVLSNMLKNYDQSGVEVTTISLEALLNIAEASQRLAEFPAMNLLTIEDIFDQLEPGKFI